ncbi:MAG: hypothetical protein ACTTKL_09280 [Treponema sp.]
MNIEFGGNGDENNKVVFEKLLAKWDDLFTRKTLFDGMELAETENGETEKGETITFTHNDTKLTFYQTKSDKANKSDLMFSAEKVAAALESMISMKFLYNDLLNTELDESNRSVKIMTKIVYEIDTGKWITFGFSKITDSNDVILHIAFWDNLTKTELQAEVIAASEENSEITLNALLKALNKEEIYVHFENFKSQIAEYKKQLQFEKLQPAFDALDEL